MGSAWAALLGEERREGFARLTGSRIRATIPLREPFVAWAIARARLPSAIRGLDVRFLPDSRVAVEADVQVLGFGKRLRTVLRVEDSMQAGPPKTLRLAFVGRSFLSSAAAWAGSALGGHGIEVRDGIVTIDLDALAARAGVTDLAEHLHALGVSGDKGVLWVAIDAEVIRPSAGRLETAGNGSGGSRPAGARGDLRPEDVAAWLKGLHVDATLRIAESLANAAIAALAEEIRNPVPSEPVSSRASADWKPLLQALPPPRLRFENGAMVVEGEVEL